jgi:TonB family protein
MAQPETYSWYAIAEIPAPPKSSELMYDIHSRSFLPVKQDKLGNAELMGDIIPYYPEHWMDTIISSRISVSSQKNIKAAFRDSDRLSDEQKILLKSLDVGTDLDVQIKYGTKNSVTGQPEEHMMKLTITVMPESEAAYVGGYPKMSKYLWDHAITKINPNTSEDLREARVRFEVDQEGMVRNAQIVISSGNTAIDQLLLDSISNMPAWKPAESNGRKVKQEFEFSIYGGGQGC